LALPIPSFETSKDGISLFRGSEGHILMARGSENQLFRVQNSNLRGPRDKKLGFTHKMVKDEAFRIEIVPE
jgi:hypothetical protein